MFISSPSLLTPKMLEAACLLASTERAGNVCIFFINQPSSKNALNVRSRTVGFRTPTTGNPTRQAVFEYDQLVRSIYTLKYLRDPQLERNICRSLNQIESYHHLRVVVAKVGGKKELTGKNDFETDISNQCGRLVSNAIVYYNSAILSRLLERQEPEGNDKGIEALTRISTVAWQHILLNGHYTFQNSNEIIDLDALVAGLKLG